MLNRIIHRPIAVTMIVIAVAVVGILLIRKMPVSLMPNIDIPQISIHTSLPGASVREVEEKVTRTFRQQLMQVAGAKDVTSESRADASVITMTFTPGANMDLLFIEVNEKVDRAMNYMSRDIERPKIVKASSIDIPAFYLDISYKDYSFSKNNPMALSTFARSIVSKRLEQLPQTAMVDMSGTVGTEIICVPDQSKMKALGVTSQHIEQAINNGNITLEALSVKSGLLRYNVHFDSQILTIDDIKEIQFYVDGRLLSLGQLCNISERPSQSRSYVRHNGKDAITMAVIKQNDARMDDLQASVNSLIADLEKEYPDIAFDLTRDQTQLLDYSISNLLTNLVLGIVLACIVLILFMRNKRLPILIIVSIPLSLILTLIVFRLIGVSLNVISLSGLILGVGMIIDNSIIVIDNITQKHQQGISLGEAVVKGTKEVFSPMLSSVLTTCSVFVPLIFISGTAGALFYDQAMGVAIALFASLLIALTIVPVYLYGLFKKKESSLDNGTDSAVTRYLTNGYERVMALFFKHSRVVLSFFVLLAISVGLLFGVLKKERLPEVAHTDAIMTIDWNLGILIEENDRRVNELLDGVKDDVRSTTSMVGAQEFLLSHTKDITTSEAVIYISCSSVENLRHVKDLLTETIQDRYPRASVDFSVSGNIYDVIFNSDESDLVIRLQSNEGGRPDIASVRAVRDSLRIRFPHVTFPPVVTENTLLYRANMESLALYGISYSTLYYHLKGLVGKDKVFTINDGAQSVPVIIGAGAPSKDALLETTIHTSEGLDIPLSLLVKSVQSEDYKRLYAAACGEYYPIMVNADDEDVEDIIGYVKENIKDKLTVSFTGGYFSARDMIAELSIVLAIALALLYFILAAQFESLTQPMIILSEMVVDVAVVFLVLWILGESLNIMSMIGLVVMSGIIINDSILKIDTINRLRVDGLDLKQAIYVAGHKRLKPIIMTSLTTILAIAPLLSRADMGSALQYPLSLTIIIGMIVGTAVSLFFVPLVYWLMYKGR